MLPFGYISRTKYHKTVLIANLLVRAKRKNNVIFFAIKNIFLPLYLFVDRNTEKNDHLNTRKKKRDPDYGVLFFLGKYD